MSLDRTKVAALVNESIDEINAGAVSIEGHEFFSTMKSEYGNKTNHPRIEQAAITPYGSLKRCRVANRLDDALNPFLCGFLTVHSDSNP